MTRESTNENKSSGRTIAAKLKMYAGCGAVVAAISGAPTAAEADIVQSTTVTGTVSNANNSTVETAWDIDNDGTGDFALMKTNVSTLAGSVIVIFGSAHFDDRNGGRLVVPSSASGGGIAKLPLLVNIGPTLTANYKFHLGQQGGNTMTQSSGQIAGIGTDASLGGWSLGDMGFFGFKFTNGADTHFGWGEMVISSNGTGFQVLQAYYNDRPNGSIQVGQTTIPEPSSVALLAMGAAGLATWRRRRQV